MDNGTSDNNVRPIMNDKPPSVAPSSTSTTSERRRRPDAPEVSRGTNQIRPSTSHAPSSSPRSDSHSPGSVRLRLRRHPNEAMPGVALNRSPIAQNSVAARVPERSNSATVQSNQHSVVARIPQRSNSASSPRSIGRRLQQSKAVKELKVSQQNLSKYIQDRRTCVLSLGTLRQEQQTKRIHKLKISQQRLSMQLRHHQDSLQSLLTDNLKRKDKKVVDGMKRELETLLKSHHEQRALVHSLYSEKIYQEQSRAARLKDDQKRLKETLLDYGAALKTLHRSRQQSKGIRKLEREQQDLCRKVHGLGEPIHSININTLEREHLKKTNQLERDLESLSKRVGDHGGAIQSLCSVQQFFPDLR
jgi:hypothetical protein